MSKPEQRSSFSGPHAFVEPEDGRMGRALGSVRTNTPMAWALDTTERAGREVRCRVCGKGRHDPIHIPLD